MDARCLSCGRDTAAGTRLFSGRKRGRDNETAHDGYLCLACQPGGARPEGGDQEIPLSGRFVVVDLPGAGRGF